MLTIAYSSLQKVSFLSFPTQKSLNLANIEMINIAAFAYIGISLLEQLVVTGNPLTNIQHTGYVGLSIFNNLALYGMSLSMLSNGIFGGIPQLRFLDISNHKIT